MPPPPDIRKQQPQHAALADAEPSGGRRRWMGPGWLSAVRCRGVLASATLFLRLLLLRCFPGGGGGAPGGRPPSPRAAVVGGPAGGGGQTGPRPKADAKSGAERSATAGRRPMPAGGRRHYAVSGRRPLSSPGDLQNYNAGAKPAAPYSGEEATGPTDRRAQRGSEKVRHVGSRAASVGRQGGAVACERTAVFPRGERRPSGRCGNGGGVGCRVGCQAARASGGRIKAAHRLLSSTLPP